MTCPICAEWRYISIVKKCPICGAPGKLNEVRDAAEEFMKLWNSIPDAKVDPGQCRACSNSHP